MIAQVAHSPASLVVETSITLAHPARAAPVDAGRGAAVDFVDQQRPADHACTRKHHRGQGSGRAVHDLTRTGQPESLTNRRPIAANQHPYGKADKAGNANACRDIGRRFL
jgi:hypothetical protein